MPRKKRSKGTTAGGAPASLPPRSLGNVAKSKPASVPAASWKTRSGSAKLKSGPRNSVRVTHREYCFDLFPDGTAYVSQRHLLNPTNGKLFPWLSRIAALYESYRFNSLVFRFEPSVSTTIAGSVMMAVDYDPDDGVAPDKATLLSYSGAVRGPLWSEVRLSCPKTDLGKVRERFVRQNEPSVEPRTADVGWLNVALNCSSGAGVSVGEVWCEYDLVLSTPATTFGAYDINNSISVTSTASGTNTPFGSVTYTGNLPVSTTSSKLTIGEPGNFLMNILATGSNMADRASITSNATITPLGPVTFSSDRTQSSQAYQVSAKDSWILQPSWVNIASTLSNVYIMIAPWFNSIKMMASPGKLSFMSSPRDTSDDDDSESKTHRDDD